MHSSQLTDCTIFFASLLDTFGDYIYNKYRNRGIGGRIFKLTEDYLRTKQCKSIRIDVVTSYDDKVTEFWGKFGFRQVDDIELNWCGNILPAALMIKDI